MTSGNARQLSERSVPPKSLNRFGAKAVGVVALVGERVINFTLAGVENVPVVLAVLDKGHQRNRPPRPLAVAVAVGGQLPAAPARIPGVRC
jgi:hypothetical protein